jgi:hypothetical protein
MAIPKKKHSAGAWDAGELRCDERHVAAADETHDDALHAALDQARSPNAETIAAMLEARAMAQRAATHSAPTEVKPVRKKVRKNVGKTHKNNN